MQIITSCYGCARFVSVPQRFVSVERSDCICRNRSSVHELTSIVRGCIQDLREAMAAGVLALTSVDHRLAALRTAVISIER